MPRFFHGGASASARSRAMAARAGMARESAPAARRSRSGRSEASPSMPTAAMADARTPDGVPSGDARARASGSAAASPRTAQTCSSAQREPSEHSGARSASRAARDTSPGGELPEGPGEAHQLPARRPRAAGGAARLKRLPQRVGHRTARVHVRDGGIALPQELDAVVTPDVVRPRVAGHPDKKPRKLGKPLLLAEERKHHVVLQAVELQAGEGLELRRRLKEPAASLQPPPVEVGGEAVDQLQALGIGGLPSRLAEDRRQRLVNPRRGHLPEETASQKQAREESEEGRGAGICADASMEGHCLQGCLVSCRVTLAWITVPAPGGSGA